MKKLQIKLKNCYGIKELGYDFDFTNSNSYSIYAPNGTMKTSFAKTFFQIQNSKEPKDLMFPARETEYEILDENNHNISPDDVFVIHPYSENYKSNKITNLLLKEDLKNRYNTEYDKIKEAEEKFYEILLSFTGLRSLQEVKNEILNSFAEENILDVILKQNEVVNNENSPLYETIIYNELFNTKARKFLEDEKDVIEEYINRYEHLVTTSDYLGKDFNHYKAKKIGGNLDKEKFFVGGHKLSFKNKNTGEFLSIDNSDDYNTLIKSQEDSLLDDSVLKEALTKLNKSIKNSELEKLRDYLFEHKHILTELSNPVLFSKKLWIDYFKSNLREYNDFLSKIISGRSNIESILDEAKNDKADWNEAIEEFNGRFRVPFSLSVNNIEDILTKSVEPAITFTFTDKDNGENIERGKEEILEVLSQGEKRALYLLNIIFEINARKKQGKETLFIIDDIADSFDYNNKYAIIEYLNDVNNNDLFKQIILTHNFDFFRTVQSRLGLLSGISGNTWEGANLSTFKQASGKISLIPCGEYLDAIENFRNNCHLDEFKYLALIPIARNIVKYVIGEDDRDYRKLTSLLHIKGISESFDLNELTEMYNALFFKSFALNKAGKVLDLIFSKCSELLTEATERLNLEYKIVLSIGIRLKAEKFMFTKPSAVEQNGNQTRELYKLLISKDELSDDEIKVLDRVLLMTPENIHLNSFMYEPILDLSDAHLKDLYRDVLALS